MHTLSPTEPRELSLVEIIDFKWLMGGLGHGVHVERMQADRAYARDCLLCGACSPAPTVRAAAHRLARRMDISLATG